LATVTTEPTIEAASFLARVKPLLEKQDLNGLHDLLKNNYTHTQLADLLKTPDPDVRKVAALSFGLVGGPCCLHKLAPILRDHDPMVNQMAEHAMWAIWFRAGTREANCELKCGSRALDRRDYARAISHFDKAIELDPNFAEAYNQRAIVHYLEERYEQSIEQCRRAVELMPCHFGAWAGLGHCHCHSGRLTDALECYEKALSINPHLEGVSQAVDELKQKLRHGDSSGD
jgi:tetratricopeptide (TPR) repeat protein